MLAVVLWLLAAVAIAVGAMTLWAGQTIRSATSEREQLDERLAFMTVRDTILYLGATRDRTRAGIPVRGLSPEERAVRALNELGGMRSDPLGDEVRVDGRPYVTDGGVTFSIQDESGLFSIVLPEAYELDRYLTAREIDPGEIPRLRDALLDYIDLDTLTRLNGAEKSDYERAKAPTPPGRRLLVPSELGAVLGWSKLDPALLASIADEVTPYYSGAVNMNTAPASLLPSLLPGCPETCRLFELRRSERAFADSYDLEARVGVRLPGDAVLNYRYLPSEEFRLTLQGTSGAAWRIHVRLTPRADKAAPWAILAVYPVSRPNDAARSKPTAIAFFPDDPPSDR